MELVIPYKPHAAQRQFHNSPARFKAIITGVGFGKSAAGSNETIKNIVRYPNTTGLIIAPNSRILNNATMVQFWQFCPKELIKHYHRSKNEITFINGHKLLCLTADNERHINRLRGVEIGYFWADEARMFQGLLWNVLIGRLREKNGPRIGYVTTTPNGRDWIYRLFEDKLDPVSHKKILNGEQYTYFTGSTLENPHLPEDYKKLLLSQYSGKFLEQEVYGKFTSFEGAVYENFTHAHHILRGTVKKQNGEIYIQLPDRKVRLHHFVAGLDKGFTNPMACEIIGYDHDDRAYVLNEYYQRKQHIKDVGRWLQEKMNFYPIDAVYVDPSTADGIDELETMGLPVVAADNQVMEGISHVHTRFEMRHDKRARLYILERCKHLIEELGTYRYKEKKEGKEEKEEPLKVSDHACDALRYALFTDNMNRGEDISKLRFSDPDRTLF